VRRLGIVGAVCMVAAVLGLTLAPAAGAVDIIEAQDGSANEGWQAGTCTADFPTQCSPQTPAQFFTQAAGHPPTGFTQIIAKHTGPFQTPVGDLKTVLVDLPRGLSVNPQATPQCMLENGKFPGGGCPANTKVGESFVTASVLGLLPVTLPGFPVYNIAPREGEPARFGFKLDLSVLGIGIGNLGEVFLNAGVAWESDYHEYFTIHVPPVPGGLAKILKNRLVFDGTTETAPGGGRFLTNPSTCLDPAAPGVGSRYSTFLHIDSVQEPAPEDEYDVNAPATPSAGFRNGSQAAEAPLPPGVKPTGCEQVPFTPTTTSTAGTSEVDSPAAPTVNVEVPFNPTAPIYQSNVRDAVVTLPLGMGVNPSAAPSLHFCTDAQFNRGSRSPVACPADSAIGTVAIDTPVLPDGTLRGSVYLGSQLSRDPESGNVYRIFIDAESPARGLSVRLLGNVVANAKTGQLTAIVREAPEVPFDRISVQLNGGAKATLSSPPTCGPNRTAHAMTAWSGTPDAGPADPGFNLTSLPGGGPCPKTMGERPFSPGFSAQPNSKQALDYTPFQLQISRSDGQQEIKGMDITLPPGATAKLAGVSYCPPQQLAAAAGKSGASEKQDASCPGDSHIGSATVLAGTGSSPLQIEGDVYLAGPYQGAPLSLGVVTPALAGPFDLGTVVIRVPIFVDPETAQIHTRTDAIPDVFGGAKLDVRSIAVNLDRKEFTLNGTNCAPQSTTGSVKGGGSDPTNPASFSSANVSSGVKLDNCDRLDFKPKLKLRLFGAIKRNKSPKLRAELKARAGDANIGRASVALPHALFLKQSSIAQICTRVQFAASQCPRKSVYGYARAYTPLLASPLEGPVYLRSSNNTLPDMVAHLGGQIDIDLVGRIDSFRGGIRTTFDRVPDVPVSKFVLTLPGGKHGLLVASRNLCAKAVKAIIQLKGQNGKTANKRPKLQRPCKGKHHKKHRGKHHKKGGAGKHGGKHNKGGGKQNGKGGKQNGKGGKQKSRES